MFGSFVSSFKGCKGSDWWNSPIAYTISHLSFMRCHARLLRRIRTDAIVKVFL